MLRLEDAVTGYVHHTVAHCRSAEHTECCHYDGCAEFRSLGSDCGIKEINRVVAHSHPQVRDRKGKQEDHKT